MIFGRRGRFHDVVGRQLAMFEREHADLLREVRAAERAYDDADRDEATQRYGEYVDLVETGTEALAEIRDAYAATLDEDTAARYAAEFDRTVARRLPDFALELGDT
ncbi:MAG: hypothetical protein ACM33B_12020 [Pseudomonadota bacterium]